MKTGLKSSFVAAGAGVCLLLNVGGASAHDRGHHRHGQHGYGHHEPVEVHHHYHYGQAPAVAQHGAVYVAPAPQVVYQPVAAPRYGAGYAASYAPEPYYAPQAYASQGYAQSPNFGNAVGGALGGFVGSRLGKGSGRLATTAAGTVAGYLLGGHIGNQYRY